MYEIAQVAGLHESVTSSSEVPSVAATPRASPGSPIVTATLKKWCSSFTGITHAVSVRFVLPITV